MMIRINTIGRAIAVNLSQNWNACTKVIDRIPPVTTVTQTTTATATEPTHDGNPVAMLMVSAAPCSWGTM